MAARPAKRARLLSDASSSASEGEDAGSPILKVNEDYRKRFEHNKAREERQKCASKDALELNLHEMTNVSNSRGEVRPGTRQLRQRINLGI